jgi:hypothetical protein
MIPLDSFHEVKSLNRQIFLRVCLTLMITFSLVVTGGLWYLSGFFIDLAKDPERWKEVSDAWGQLVFFFLQYLGSLVALLLLRRGFQLGMRINQKPILILFCES